VGDELLVGVGARITEILRPGDTLARQSGDEFVVVCEELDRKDEAEIIAARIVEAVARPFDLSGTVIEITVSVGCACAGLRDKDPEVLIHEADLAMYQVKRKGGGRFQLLDRREQLFAISQVGLERDLRQAVAREELHVAYQPVVRTSDGRIVGAEALLRWNHPSRGAIPPTTMIALAERSELIVALGAWVLERACIDRHRWGKRPEVDNFEIAVNVSPHQLMAPGFSTMVTDTLARTRTPAQLCTLEITESAFVQEEVHARIVLDEIKALGVRIALDDFGTGYSSLNYLKVFPIDALKLDRSFVMDVASSRSSRAIVAKLIELAHLLDLEVVSEGVETIEQRDEVQRLGSDFSQGYYFARPSLPDHLDALMDSGPDGAILPHVAVLGA
jgi:predicted signal transduction protein with EAL and GGDEF domain